MAEMLWFQPSAGLELAGVVVGAFNDQQVAGMMKLPNNLRPIYLLPIGYPR
jgi:hypothetical protein